MTVQTKKIDPRAARTRVLIQEAFLSLASEKIFESITVKDIAERASINRATFYAHFNDKYALLDNLLSEAFSSTISSTLQPNIQLNKDTLNVVIIALCNYHEDINNHCNKVYKSISSFMDNNIQDKLQELIAIMLTNTASFGIIEQEKLKLLAIMISNSLYGATSYWYSKGKIITVSELSEDILTFVMPGIKMFIS
ncbi:transcriptional regulator, TetR family [Clostridium acidisoli DSM 12555]|uniref:Transcriptional regulator, TetR family n=1 Tax=Clostridium acidisoli DSM 12555 TaxID=1121291 RepID=A0A1W1XQ21_9CLOT|nr:TetR/AcrR family transcriptional regulator [Clostridium acidisoli]SMC25945.1 transcriptional regulator, TetR family [Clostridium acidisoli DSM 12555]